MNIRAKLFHMLFPKEEHLLAEREAMLAKIRKDKRVLQNIINSQNERCSDLQKKIEQIGKDCKRNMEIAESYKSFFEKAGRILKKGK